MTEEPHADAARRHGAGEPPRAGEEDLFAALDRTRADLAAAPVPPLPEGFAARLRDTLAAERAGDPAAAPPATPSSSAPSSAPSPASSSSAPSSSASARGSSRPPARPGPSRPAGPARRRRRALAAGLLALAAVAAVSGGLLAGAGATPAPTAAPGPPAVGGPEPVSGRDPVRALRAGLGARDPGPLADPARRAACLVAHGVPAGTVPLGSRQVSVDGRPGTLLVLPTGRAARFRLLAVGPGCAPDRPETLVDLVVGG